MKDTDKDNEKKATAKGLPPIKIETLPFGKGLPPDQIFVYSQLNELKQMLKRAIESRSMALVCGQAGVGKTTGVHSALCDLPPNRYSVVYLGQDQDGSNLMRRLAAGLGLQSVRFRKHALLQIGHFLSDNLSEQGKTPIVVVDESHDLDDATLEDLRLLTNADFDRTSPVVLILLAQLPLRSRLKKPDLEALNQRLRFRYALEGFTEEETVSYVKHHLRLQALSEDLFSVDALKTIFQASRGIPREINNYCTLALLKAESLQASRVDIKIVRQILDQRELN